MDTRLSRISGDLALNIVKNDVQVLIKKAEDYGDSWKKRGGGGAFMMLARKWDRISQQTQQRSLLAAMGNDDRDEGIRDDVRDLRRYLILVLHELHEPLDYAEGMTVDSQFMAWELLEQAAEFNVNKWDVFNVKPGLVLNLFRSLLDLELKGWSDGSIASL